jgi:TldD protein
MTQNQNLFFQKFGITPNDLQRYLGEALSAGGDYADLYFEYLTSTSISVDESIVKSASQGISAGCGVRVLAGERTGYAYTDDLAPVKNSARGADRSIDCSRPSQESH